MCKYEYGVSLTHTSTPERRVVTHTVKITRPAGPVPIYYGIYAIHPAKWRGFITVRGDQIKHGPGLAGVDTGVAGVDTVGRTYGASLFGRMTTYIN